MGFREDATQGILINPPIAFEQELVAAPLAGKIRSVINYIISAETPLTFPVDIAVHKKKAGTKYFIQSAMVFNSAPMSGTLDRRLQLVGLDESLVFIIVSNFIGADVSWNVSWGDID